MAIHIEAKFEKEHITSTSTQTCPDLPDIEIKGEKFIVDQDAQPGVQQIEAVTAAWTTTALVAAYVMIWIIYFVEGTLSGSANALNPYVTSAFAQHSLTPTVGIISSIIGGVTNLTLAKVLDVFGRPQGYLLCVVIATIGLIMMAACNNVEAYATAVTRPSLCI